MQDASTLAPGGTRDQILHGTTGLLVADTDPRPLADAIVKVLTDRNLAETIGQNGRAHVLESFPMDHMVQAYLGLLGIAQAVPGGNSVTRLPSGKRIETLKEIEHANAA